MTGAVKAKKEKSLRTAVHLIPYDGIGGVEVAARSLSTSSLEDFDLYIKYIYPKELSQIDQPSAPSPWPIFRSVWRLLEIKPDLLIVSLWRSCIVAALAKIFLRQTRLILFLHLPHDVHWLDRLVTRYIAKKADEIWSDSIATMSERLPETPTHKCHVISFLARSVNRTPVKTVKPVFIFWGRIHPQKDLARALRIFAGVHHGEESARFIVIGPDGGDLARVERLANDLGVSDSVEFTGAYDFSSIQERAIEASFYLQTSTQEGMAMSVVEAMQLGLMPIVTPVGEIANYCKDGINSLYVLSDEEIVSEILSLLREDMRYQAMCDSAVATWANKELYAESFSKACREILCTDSSPS